MIPWIRCPLIQHFHRLAAQPRKLPLEAQIADPAHLVAIIILHEQRQAVGVPEQRALDGNLLDIRGLGQGQSLRGMGVRGGRKVQVVFVEEEVEGFGRGGGVGGTDEKRM